MRQRLAVLLGAALVALAVLGTPARAQAGMGTDVITGTVRGEDGAPLLGATIEATSLETQVTRRAVTDARGRFTILFPDGGGQYRMTARAIGMSPRIELLQRYADEDRLVWNVQLRGGVVTLDAITVRSAPAITRAPDGPTPGATERALSQELLARLPTDATDLALLAALVPGVTALGASDTTAAAFSVAGLGADANALTLDGLLFGTSSVPQEGLRQTRVITSTYDVSRGQFSGGMIASTTRSGSNVMQGSSQYQLRDDDLALGGEESPYAQGFTQHVASGGIGGPLVRDRLFWFGSLQLRMRSDPQQTLLSAGPADYQRLGVHPDSVARFLAILSALGVPPASVPGSATRTNDNLSGLLRLDWVVSNAHTLSLRGDWRGTDQDPTRLGPLALPQTGGVLESSGGGVMATLTSRFGATVLNEARAYWQTSRSDADPFTLLPQGRVQVASDLDDGSRGVATLVFGGNAGLPSRSRGHSLEASNELSWLPGSGGHRFKLGAYVLRERATQLTGSNLLGTFQYNSLADLDAGRAASYRRVLEPTDRTSPGTRWGVYGGDVWMVTRPFQLTYGVRLEGSSFGAVPAYNPAVETVFGRRTDRLPAETHVSPRVGFTWTLGGAPFERGRMPSPPTLVIRGGIGEFRSQPPANLVAQARAATGVDDALAQVSCVGAAVPAPAWGQYWLDPSTIPDGCADAGPGLPPDTQPARSVVLLADGFEAPRAWRGSLGVERRLTQLFRLTVEGSFSRGIRQAGFRDLNLDATPRFTLADEGGRPVYVAEAAIAPASGAASFAASRVDPAFGNVYEAASTLESRALQLTVGVGGILGRGIVLNGSYTWQRVRDEATGARGGTTAGDPNAAEWARSELERRHSFLATITYPLSTTVELTSIGRLTSGAPFTPTVGGDVNGDGARNDRAFIFDPLDPGDVAEGMARLLASAPGAVRGCLRAQVGRVAGRNSCTGPWQASLDFQLNWRPTLFGLNRRLTVSVMTVNFLRGLDELLHGAARAKGWGLMTRPDPTLLYVTGFDTAGHRFRYEVNERFGATAGSANAFRPPFQIGIQMRYTIGPDRMRQALDAMRGGGRPVQGPGLGMGMGGGPGEGGGPGAAFRFPAANAQEMVARLEAALPNAAAVAIQLRDSLGLDSAQVVLLTPVRDSLAARNQVRLDSLRSVLRREGDSPNLMRVMPVLRPLFEAARNDVAQSLATVRAILTEEQWERLPENVRTLPMMLRPGPQRP